MPANSAAVLPGTGQPLVVQDAPYTAPGENYMVIRAHAIAVNPIDYGIQMLGDKLFPWVKYPFVLGADVAGEVVQVGSAVKRFKIGDRALGHAVGSNSGSAPEGAFQLYPLVQENMASIIPENISYNRASVIPLAFSTAAMGLFQKDYLSLQYPTVQPKSTGKTLLIWGGATSVGSNAIQFAGSAGYEVIATASPKNFDYIKKLGASQAFDYKSPSIREDLIKAFIGKICAGALAIAGVVSQARNEAAEACLEVVSKSQGDKFVVLSMPLPENIPEGVTAKFIVASNIKDNEASHAVYGDYLSKALAAGIFTPAPETMVVGDGLGALQGALDTLKGGVSAKKVVVTVRVF